MSDVEKMLAGYIKPAEAATGDYRGPGGLLYCGKCHEPKEAIVDMSDARLLNQLIFCEVKMNIL